MTSFTHLTNKELLSQLLTRDDLTELEHELVDRLDRLLDMLDYESRAEGERAR